MVHKKDKVIRAISKEGNVFNNCIIMQSVSPNYCCLCKNTDNYKRHKTFVVPIDNYKRHTTFEISIDN